MNTFTLYATIVFVQKSIFKVKIKTRRNFLATAQRADPRSVLGFFRRWCRSAFGSRRQLCGRWSPDWRLASSRLRTSGSCPDFPGRVQSGRRWPSAWVRSSPGWVWAAWSCSGERPRKSFSGRCRSDCLVRCCRLRGCWSQPFQKTDAPRMIRKIIFLSTDKFNIHTRFIR